MTYQAKRAFHDVLEKAILNAEQSGLSKRDIRAALLRFTGQSFGGRINSFYLETPKEDELKAAMQ
jgi:hypothetical protein